MKQRLQFRIQALRDFVIKPNGLGPSVRQLYVDGIYCRITISGTPDDPGAALFIDGASLSAFSAHVDASTFGPLMLEFPIVYGVDGRPIRYDQRITLSCAAPDSVSGNVLHVDCIETP